MRRLEGLLLDIHHAEREEALKYYDGYISDSGKENEAAVLAGLGTPEQVAAIIKDGLEGNSGDFTESGYHSHAATSVNQVTHYRPPGEGRQDEPPPKKERSSGEIALIVILCILASPLIIGLGAGLFGAFIGLTAGLFSIVLAFGITVLVLLLVGFVLIITGFVGMFGAPLLGLATMSVGLLMAGFGLLFLTLTVLLVGKAVPAIIKGIGKLVSKITKRVV
jgi:uncharacterized membrane protein